MQQVVSLFAITGGLAVDCVRQGHTEYLAQLVEGIAAVIEDELVAWINENGGWVCWINLQSFIQCITTYDSRLV